MQTRSHRFVALLLLLSAFSAALAAQQISEPELRSVAGQSITFENYQGPYQKIETVAEIRGIGEFMGRSLAGPEEGQTEYFGRYRVQRVLPADGEAGFGADLFSIEPGGLVDHIDNVRRILAGYLAEAYGYSPEQAATLAFFATIYNAVFRQDFGRIADRYTPAVAAAVDPDRFGISTRFAEWAGGTQMIIPLRPTGVSAGPGLEGPLELADPEVIERLQEEPDRAVEERRDLADLADDTIAAEEEALQRDREAAEEEAARRTDDDGDDSPAATEDSSADASSRTPATDDDQADAPGSTPDADSDPFAEREQTIADATERAQEIRDQTAEDQEELGDTATQQIQPLAFLLVRETGGQSLGQLVSIDATSGTQLAASEADRIVGRQFAVIGGNYLVLTETGGSARLTLIDRETLDTSLVGSDEIAVDSIVAARDRGATIFAVVRAEGDWRLGRFDGNLNLLEVSSQVVEPAGFLAFDGGAVFAQAADGSIFSLPEAGFAD